MEQAFLAEVLRWMGLCLQLGGVATIGLGISRVRAAFNRKDTIIDKLRDVLWYRILRRKKKASGGAVSRVELDAASSGYKNLPIDQSLPIEDRLTNLENCLKELNEGLPQKLASTRTKWREDISRETEARKNDKKEMKRLVEDTAAGGLDLEIYGCMAFALGIPLGTIPGEIAWLIQRVWSW
jgi:hypothetical protein